MKQIIAETLFNYLDDTEKRAKASLVNVTLDQPKTILSNPDMFLCAIITLDEVEFIRTQLQTYGYGEEFKKEIKNKALSQCKLLEHMALKTEGDVAAQQKVSVKMSHLFNSAGILNFVLTLIEDVETMFTSSDICDTAIILSKYRRLEEYFKKDKN